MYKVNLRHLGAMIPSGTPKRRHVKKAARNGSVSDFRDREREKKNTPLTPLSCDQSSGLYYYMWYVFQKFPSSLFLVGPVKTSPGAAGAGNLFTNLNVLLGR